MNPDSPYCDALVEQTTFFTLVESVEGEQHAYLLIQSLRAFGGALRACPVWVFHHRDYQPTLINRALMDDVHLLPLALKETVRYYFFIKACACAQAEGMADQNVRSLVWLNPQNLIVNPPHLFDLASPAGASFLVALAADAAFRTVHHRNVGSLARAPLDAFWRAIYKEAVLSFSRGGSWRG